MNLSRVLVAAPALGLALTGVLAAPALASTTPSETTPPGEFVALGADTILAPVDCGFDPAVLDRVKEAAELPVQGASDPRIPDLTYMVTFFNSNIDDSIYPDVEVDPSIDMARFDNFVYEGEATGGDAEWAVDTDFDGTYDVYYSYTLDSCVEASGFVYDQGVPLTVVPIDLPETPVEESPTPSETPTPSPTSSPTATTPSPTVTPDATEETDEVDESTPTTTPTGRVTNVPAGNTDGSDIDGSELALGFGAIGLSLLGATGLVVLARRHSS